MNGDDKGGPAADNTLVWILWFKRSGCLCLVDIGDVPNAGNVVFNLDFEHVFLPEIDRFPHIFKNENLVALLATSNNHEKVIYYKSNFMYTTYYHYSAYKTFQMVDTLHKSVGIHYNGFKRFTCLHLASILI